mmetsp:Transcript_15184/g.17724  ORF Transcript_15184/g.17724 Transcript_15184/m.17724 type:complete len:120 (-) Transcript_15184:1122-1481(-)
MKCTRPLRENTCIYCSNTDYCRKQRRIVAEEVEYKLRHSGERTPVPSRKRRRSNDGLQLKYDNEQRRGHRSRRDSRTEPDGDRDSSTTSKDKKSHKSSKKRKKSKSKHSSKAKKKKKRK